MKLISRNGDVHECSVTDAKGGRRFDAIELTVEDFVRLRTLHGEQLTAWLGNWMCGFPPRSSAETELKHVTALLQAANAHIRRMEEEAIRTKSRVAELTRGVQSSAQKIADQNAELATLRGKVPAAYIVKEIAEFGGDAYPRRIITIRTIAGGIKEITI